MTDSAERRVQIAQLYSSMSDSELKSRADEAWTLTESGKEVLRVELARRGLKFDLVSADVPKVPAGDLVTLRKFGDLPEALLAKGFLESAGIESVLIDETMIRMYSPLSNLLGGVKLRVNLEDAGAAAQILNQEIPGKINFEGNGDFVQPRCPQCQSLDIVYDDLNKPATYAVTFLLSNPFQISRRQWNCQSCGYNWELTDEGPQQSK